MMTLTRRLPLLLAVAIALASCGAREAPPAPPPAAPSLRVADLVGTEWIAESIESAPSAEGVQSTLRFASVAQVDGDTGCNRFTGPLKAENDTLHIGPLATTRRACPPAQMDQERRYLVALARGVALQRDGDALILLDENKRALVRYTQVEPHVPARP